MEEVIDISDDFGSNWSKQSSTNFGGGLEYLMNSKKQENKLSFDISTDDIGNLENELNELVDDTETIKLNIGDNFPETNHVRFNNSTLGESTSHIDTEAKTWDGYGKFNNIPVNPDIHIPNEPKMSKDEQMREKFRYLKKLEGLEKKGVQLSKKYDMESNFNEMKCEYDMIMEDKAKEVAIKFQANMMTTIIGGIEWLNDKFDPFDIDLTGWSDQIQENINDYDDIFAALHDKYKSKPVSPELQLMLQLGGSAVMVHVTNRMLKSSMPTMDNILRQDPDLMRQFQTAALNSMSNSNPGFSNYMSNMMNNNAPPPSMNTKAQSSNLRDQPIRSNQVRPDIEMARGVFADDGINIHESNASVPSYEKSSRRPEMKGPSDLGDILSGLKTKTINVNVNDSKNRTQQRSQPQQTQTQQPQQTQNLTDESFIELTPISLNEESNNTQSRTNNYTNMNNNSSTISVEDLNTIGRDFNAPKKSKRRPKSDKNTIVLDF